jgi:hypothetical protein
LGVGLGELPELALGLVVISARGGLTASIQGVLFGSIFTTTTTTTTTTTWGDVAEIGALCVVVVAFTALFYKAGSVGVREDPFEVHPAPLQRRHAAQGGELAHAVPWRGPTTSAVNPTTYSERLTVSARASVGCRRRPRGARR